MSEAKHTPIKAVPAFDGTQAVYRFDNGFGASVIRHQYSYGHAEGLYELAVVKFSGDNFDFHYDNEVAAGDVVGFLSESAVEDLLDKIAAFAATESA